MATHRMTASALALAALPLVSACRAEEGAEALAGAALASLALPTDLHQMRLTHAERDAAVLRIDAQPAVGGPLPRSETAETFACDRPELAALIAAGGRVEITLSGRPFALITDCGAAP